MLLPGWLLWWVEWWLLAYPPFAVRIWASRLRRDWPKCRAARRFCEVAVPPDLPSLQR
jgi:hypothetical protein